MASAPASKLTSGCLASIHPSHYSSSTTRQAFPLAEYLLLQMARPNATVTSTSPTAALVVVPAHVVDAIAVATTHGTWGDICFVVRSQGGDSAYACVYAHLATIRAAGAERLVNTVMRNGVATLHDAVKLLDISPHRSSAVISPEGSLCHFSPYSTGQRRYVAIKDLALTTLWAMLMFVQTGRIEFAPLNSMVAAGSTKDVSALDDGEGQATAPFDALKAEQKAEERKHEGAAFCGTEPRLMATSPKAAYRAARKYGLESLRQLADQAMDKQITSKNILTELFDSFTFKYPEMMEKRLRYVFENWNDIPNKNELAQIFRDCPHPGAAIHVLNAILSRTSISLPTHC